MQEAEILNSFGIGFGANNFLFLAFSGQLKDIDQNKA